MNPKGAAKVSPMATKRAYASPLRQQAAARTREQILVCAAELFAYRGYGRVTVADIAAAAGVSRRRSSRASAARATSSTGSSTRA